MSKRVYGPVRSRRLGVSLGVDPVPTRTCSYDCIYCQAGRTLNRTLERSPFIEESVILEEVEAALEKAPKVDAVTLAGWGEPTLNSRIGAILSGIRKITKARLVVITNGSLLWMNEVRNDLEAADIVIPSLDAPNEEVFKRINRPAAKLGFDKVVGGIAEFSASFHGETWLEIMLIAGVNDDTSHITDFSRLVSHIRPTKTHLNTVTRPPAEQCVAAVSKKRLVEIASRLPGEVEVIAEHHGSATQQEFRSSSNMETDTTSRIMETLRRRPCTEDELVLSTGLSQEKVSHLLEEMIKKGLVKKQRLGNNTFFSTARHSDNT